MIEVLASQVGVAASVVAASLVVAPVYISSGAPSSLAKIVLQLHSRLGHVVVIVTMMYVDDPGLRAPSPGPAPPFSFPYGRGAIDRELTGARNHARPE